MTCKEYDKITKEFENAISMMSMLEESDQRITNVLYNINFKDEKEKLCRAYSLFRDKNTRGKIFSK